MRFTASCDKKYYQQFNRLSASRGFRGIFTLNLAEVSGKNLLMPLILDAVMESTEALMKLCREVVAMGISKETLCLSKERDI